MLPKQEYLVLSPEVKEYWSKGDCFSKSELFPLKDPKHRRQK